jgi:type 2 lantibiotic biosynthesis protein LanM
MEKAYTPTAEYNGLSLENTSWYNASTLAERLAALNTLRASTSFPLTEQASKRMQRWQTQYVFKEVLAFAERLEMDGMTEEDLLTLLALPGETLRPALLSGSIWLEELARAFEGSSSTQGEALPYETMKINPSTLTFLKPVEPLLHRAMTRLREGIDRMADRYAVCPFDTNSVLSSLLAHLTSQFGNLLARTLVLELNVARLQERLEGETPEERFLYFINLLCQGQIHSVLEEYAVLARQLIIAVEHWVHYGLEFLEHLCRDWAELCATFSPASDPGPLTKIQMGAGDTHCQGRSVLLLQFRDGLQLVYKPKSLAIDTHFQELLAWLNSCGCCPPLATMKILAKGNYGWSEYIAAYDCASEIEVRRFYERQGAYLALLATLEATDFHAENLIAAGEHPMLIDLEALFHPDAARSAVEHPVAKVLYHSVLRVGLLPHRIYADDESEGIDDSGLGWRSKQLTPMPVPVWEEAGTDMMHLTRQRREMKTRQNLPRLNGQDIALLDYKDAILTGFTAMYRLLMAQRNTFATIYLPRFCKDEIRVILRPTHFYVLLLRGSLHPNNLRDGLDRDRYLDRLFFDYQKWLQPARIVAAERAALLEGDIPMFTTHVESRDLFTCQGERIPDFLQQSGFLAVQAHVQRLSEEDLRQQIWFIEASFTSLQMETHRMYGWKKNLPSSFTPATRERLLTAASKIGKRLSDLAIRDETGAGWLAVAQENKHEWSIQIAGTNLYDGATGIILFLAYLGQLTGEEQYTALARVALQTFQEILVQWKQDSQHLGIGAFQGLSSLIYLFCHLGVLWQQSELLDECENLIALLPTLIENDTNFDIISGAAGCILALLNIHQITASSSALSAAIQCGEHLCEHACKMAVGAGWKTLRQEIPLTGFSHGAAGIAYSLLRLSTVSGDARFQQIALEALVYERSLFSPKAQNWPDLRASSDTESTNQESSENFMVAWCHGAPGIGLARLASLPYRDDAEIRQEIDLACKTTLARGFGRDHSLCHGGFGNLETLLVAAQMLDAAQHYKQVERMSALLLDDIDSNGYYTGVPFGVETPGLMTGLAGIGYELLRLAYPEKVPSVLLLAPPYEYA